jgi:4'-phosphopantetheinyl transferase
MVEIFAVKLAEKEIFGEIKSELISKLPVVVAAKYNDYKHSDSLQRSLLGELLLRKVLSQKLKLTDKEINFKTGDKGKPYLSDQALYFNISHSGKWVVGAFSDKEVGIDVELIREPNYEVAKRFYSEIELAGLNSIADAELKKEYFFELWTLKESYLKAIGTGLTKSLSSFTVITAANGQIFLTDGAAIDHVFFKQYAFDKDYKLAVCSFENEFCEEIQTMDINSM